MKKMKTIKQRMISPVLMWVIALTGVWFCLRFLPTREIFAEAGLFVFVALLAGIYWLYFFVGAIAIHRKAPASVAGIEKLITEGVYGMVRHPIYMADIVLAWGVFMLADQVRVLAAVLWLTLIFVFWMVLEEKALEEKFGEEYRRYKKNVPMMVPKFGKGK